MRRHQSQAVMGLASWRNDRIITTATVAGNVSQPARQAREGIMRVTSVEAIPVSYPEPNDFNALRHLCLVKLVADDGQVGWGESITQFPEASWATKAIIDGFAPLIIGK